MRVNVFMGQLKKAVGTKVWKRDMIEFKKTTKCGGNVELIIIVDGKLLRVLSYCSTIALETLTPKLTHYFETGLWEHENS